MEVLRDKLAARDSPSGLSAREQQFQTKIEELQRSVETGGEDARKLRQQVYAADEILNEREKHILTQRRLIEEPQTLEELSQTYSVSRERVRQIEVRAFEKLQKAMLRIAGEKRLLLTV